MVLQRMLQRKPNLDGVPEEPPAMAKCFSTPVNIHTQV